jgi:2-polyprenyl-6-methoxyphenol hydroxylase-like FAD-dependent oxidoreductase
MSEQNDVPVAVVGAGPTGVMLAIELARRGVEVRIFDKQAAPPRETRAIGIHARTLELFHQLGIVEEFLDRGHRVSGLEFHTRARRPVVARFDSIDSPYPFLLTISQQVTQGILDRHLEHLGVQVERGTSVLDLAQDASGAELRIVDGRGGRTLRADWVVGCDGARSLVRRRLGVSFDGEDYAQDWLMAEVRTESPLRHDHFHVFAHTAAPLPMFPLPQDRWRIFVPEVPRPASTGERQPPTMEEIDRLVAQRGPAGLRLTDPTLLATFRAYRRRATAVREGRVFVAGDAAHIHSPAGGQGMNTGLHDAVNLAWKLALVTTERAPSTLLDTYQAERAPIADSVLAFTHALVRTFAQPSPSRRWLRDRVLPIAAALPTAERRYMTRLAQLSHSYRRSPLARLSADGRRERVRAGDRVPGVLEHLRSPGHTLLIMTRGEKDADAAQAAIAQMTRFDGLVHAVVVRTEPPRQLLLVRPDGHLACRAPLERPDIPERYLDELTAGLTHHLREPVLSSST